MILIQGSDRIDSFWFAKIWFTKVNQKSQKDFDSRGCLFLFLIHVSESFYLWFWSILIAFQNWFVKIWFAKVNQKSQKDFDSRGESKSFFFLFLIHVGESFYFCDSDPFWFTFKANIIHFYSWIFDSPKWIKNLKKILIREVNQFFFIFDSLGHIILFLIHNSFRFISILISDSNWFYSFWFGLILKSSRIAIHPRIMIHLRIKIKSKRKSKPFANQWLTRIRIESESKWIVN